MLTLTLCCHWPCSSAIAGRWEMVGSKLARVVYALDTAKARAGTAHGYALYRNTCCLVVHTAAWVMTCARAPSLGAGK